MGILEVGRLLLIYSVVSNAAQEGSRYAITRPRDVIPASLATAVASQATPTYVVEQVVPDGNCNAIYKSREKVWGISPSEVQVNVWYDRGDSTPIAVNNDHTSPNYIEHIVRPGNRVVVETTYHFTFLSPIIGLFAPGGMNIKMVSARTMLGRGNSPYSCASINLTPVPTNTSTSTPTSTPTETATFTPTPTFTVSPTATPDCGLVSAYACRVSGAGWQQWQASVRIVGFIAGDSVTVFDNNGNGGTMTCDASGNCTFPLGVHTAQANDRVTFTYLPTLGHNRCEPTSVTVDILTCGVPTVTNTPTRTNTPTVTNTRTSTSTGTRTSTRTHTSTLTPTNTRTHTSTVTPTSTATSTFTPTNTRTPTPTRTITPTQTPSSLVLTISPLKPNGSAQPLDIRVRVTDNQGNLISGASVSADAAPVSGTGGPQGPWTLSEITGAPGNYQVCRVGSFNGSGGNNVNVNVTASKGALSGSGTSREQSGIWCP
jgi:hypothetical protein